MIIGLEGERRYAEPLYEGFANDPGKKGETLKRSLKIGGARTSE